MDEPSPRGRGRGPREAWEGEGLRRWTACRHSVLLGTPSPRPSPHGRGSNLYFPINGSTLVRKIAHCAAAIGGLGSWPVRGSSTKALSGA